MKISPRELNTSTAVLRWHSRPARICRRVTTPTVWPASSITSTSSSAGFMTCQLKESARDFLEQFEDRRGDRVRCIHFEIARAGAPRFISTPGMLLRRREITVVAVGKLDGERVLEGALFLDLQADLNKG